MRRCRCHPPSLARTGRPQACRSPGHTGRMTQAGTPGWVVVLNGAPRSGKSSIATVIQETFDGPWMNLGVDVFSQHVTPPRYRPGMGLRPGGERPDIEALLPALYSAFWDSVAAHSRHGLNVVADVGLHDAHAAPVGALADGARRLSGLPVLRWQRHVHEPGLYDLEIDTSAMTP